MKISAPQLICLLAAGLLATGRGLADESAPAAPPDPELAIGQRAPAFALKDQNGQEVSLDALRNKGPVAVVFIRSADWCLFCKRQLIQIQHNLKEIQATGGQVVAVSYDSVEILKKFADHYNIVFPLLSDPDSKTIDAYYMRQRISNPGQEMAARHGTVVVDQKGTVRAKPQFLTYDDHGAVEVLVNAFKQAQIAKGEPKL